MIAIASLTACGPLSEGKTLTGVTSLATSVVSGGAADAETAASPVSGLTREAIEATPADLLLVSLVSRGSADLMTQIGTNGSTTTWVSTDGAAASFDRGMLIASRGTGFDLMGADVAPALASLGRGGQHQRVYDFLESQDEIRTERYSCEMVRAGPDIITIVERTYATTKWEETCANGRVRFVNLYWVESNGTIRQSRQYLSEGIGYFAYQRL